MGGSEETIPIRVKGDRHERKDRENLHVCLTLSALLNE
jgi:hypothetical protein